MFANVTVFPSSSRQVGATDVVRAACAAVVKAGAAATMGIGTGLQRAFAAHERWRQRQALLALDDFMLKDIGITRADVELEVAKWPWRE